MKSKKRSKVGSGVLDTSLPPQTSSDAEESVSSKLESLHIAALSSIDCNDPKNDKWKRMINCMQAEIDMTEKALQGAAVEVALVQAAKADAEKNKHQLESICRTLQARNSALKEEAELSHRREAERQEINRKFNASLDDMRQKLEKQRLLYQEQEEENDALQKKKEAVKENTRLMVKRWETASRVAGLEVEAWNRKCALQEQELIISRARLKELQNHIRISEVAFKRDSDDVDELLATFRSYKEAESDAVVQLEKEEQEMNRLLLEIENMETVNKKLRIEKASSYKEFLKEVEPCQEAVARSTSIRKAVDRLTVMNDGLRKAKESAEEEVEKLTNQLLKLGINVPPPSAGAGDEEDETE